MEPRGSRRLAPGYIWKVRASIYRNWRICSQWDHLIVRECLLLCQHKALHFNDLPHSPMVCLCRDAENDANANGQVADIPSVGGETTRTGFCIRVAQGATSIRVQLVRGRTWPQWLDDVGASSALSHNLESNIFRALHAARSLTEEIPPRRRWNRSDP